LPYRSYRYGYVYRNEKPGPGRFRQFMQFDADTVGAASMAADAEMCMLAADTMEALGIPRGSYVVKVNNRKVLDGVLDWLGIGLGDPEFSDAQLAARRLVVMRALDKYDRLGQKGVRALLGEGRTDESGDHTLGANLDPDQINRLMWLLTLRSEDHAITKDSLLDFNPTLRLLPMGNAAEAPIERDMLSAMEQSQYSENQVYADGVRSFREMEALVVAAGYNDGRIRIDPSVVRGLEYYTGPVYEVELTFEINDDKGRPVRFGSVGGGGRYDGLVSRFRGQPVPATGFSIGVSRLMAALIRLGKIDMHAPVGPVVMTVLDKGPERLADYQRIVSRLRAAGIRAELYLGSPNNNLAAQLKYADRRKAPIALIQGSNEKATGDVLIKDLIEGTEAAVFHDAVRTTRQEYLEQRAAQYPVKEADLVAEVRKLLARHTIAPAPRH
jgi:histidyl-tRNA synthetase